MAEQAQEPSDRRPVPQRRFRWIQAQAAWLAKAGVSPNAISVCGLLAAVLAGAVWSLTPILPEAERALWLTGVVLVLLRILANTLDGMVAVEWGRASKVGLLYNDAPDRLSDCALLIGMGYAHGGDAVLGLAGACIALFVSYVRLLGRLAGAPSDFSGPMDKGGRMVVLLSAGTFMGLAPSDWYPFMADGHGRGPAALALLVVCVGGVYTAGRRLARAGRHLRQAA
jgi:phosphatidylglycerophosphate synthase